MARCDLAQRRRLDAAARQSMRAARMEMASRRRLKRRRDLALERGKFPVPLLETRNLREQRLRIGWLGFAKQRLGRRHFDDAAEIHDGDTVRAFSTTPRSWLMKR